MGGKAILMLLLVVAGLGAVLWFTDEKPSIEKVAETSVLDGRSLRDCVHLRWQFHGQQAIDIGRAPDGRFQIQEPIVDLASAAYLQQIVVTWDSANMRATPLPNDEQGRKQAGLEPPQLTLVAVFPDDRRIEVAVGDPGPLGSTLFLLRDGKIWEGGEGLLESMRVGLDDLRERSVFRHAFSTASEVSVDQLLPSGKRETLHLKQAGNGWQLLAPITGSADPVTAQRFLTAVLSLRVDYFMPGLHRSPEREPDFVIIVKGLQGEETVRLWEEQGQVYGKLPDRDVGFSSDNRQYSAIFVNAAQELRARILVPMGESAFENLVELIVDPGQGRGDRIRLVRDSSAAEWQLVEPIEFAVRATPVNESAYALQRLVAQEFVSDDGVRPRAQDPRYGMTGARWTIATRRGDQQKLNTLWFGADVPGLAEPTVYVCRADEPDNIALVPKQPLEVLQRPWTDYCDLQLVRQTAFIERLEAKHQNGDKRVFLISDERWVRASIDGSDPEQPRPEVGEFAQDTLRDLIGKAAVDMRSGFGEPDWQLVMMRGNEDVLARLQVWDRSPDQPLVVRLVVIGREPKPVGGELGSRDSRALRELWK